MTALAAVRRRDRVSPAAGGTPEIDLSPLIGTWINTESRSRTISRIEVRRENGTLLIGPDDWGAVPASMVCATAVTSTEAGGYIADFSSQAQLQATLNQGLLVVVVFSRTRAGGRVTREFFRRQT